MRPGSLLATALLLLSTSVPLAAQTTWYVDPAFGDDANSGLSENDAFQTLAFAASVAVAGDTVLALDGTYGPPLQTWPVKVKDGVTIRAQGNGAELVPDFPSPAFEVDADVTQPTVVEGFRILGPEIGFLSQPVRLSGLVVRNCTFTDVSGTGVWLQASSADDHAVTVSGCTVQGMTGADTGILVVCTADGGSVLAGGIEDCTVQGGFDVGIELLVQRGTGTALAAGFGSGFEVSRNSVVDTRVGISVHLDGTAGLNGQVFSCAAPIRSNSLDGPLNAPGGAPPAGLPSIGIAGMASSSNFGVGTDCVWSSEVSHNLVSGFVESVKLDTVQVVAPGDVVDLVPTFRGNVLETTAAGGYAFGLSELGPNPAQRNADPDLGGHPDGDGSRGRNTFLTVGTDFSLFGVLEDVHAIGNWWSNSPPVVSSSTAAGVIYDPVLTNATLGDVADPHPLPNDPDAEVVVVAESGAAFVDDPDPAGPLQTAVFLDGVLLPPEDAVVEDDGNRLRVRVGAVSMGTHQLKVVPPNLMPAALFTFSTQPDDLDNGDDGDGGGIVGPPGLDSGGGSGGCFVATAANGDDDAPDVVALRSLRDEYLALTPVGRAFIRWYYAEGPKAAAVVAEHAPLRFATRLALKPLVWTARGLDGANPGQRLALAVLFLGAALGLRRTLSA